MKETKENWFPTPDVIDPPESMMMRICIPKNKDHMMAFFGALWELTKWNSWQPDTAHTGKDLAAVWMRYYQSWDRQISDDECEDCMNCCCDDKPTLKRVDPDTGQMQISTDGGVTWSPDPQDPSFAVVKQPPPIPAGTVDNQCDAATNALQHITDIINTTSGNIATAGGIFEFMVIVATALLTAAIVFITGGGASPLALTIAGLIWGAGTAVFEAGQAAFDDYWSTDNLDIVLCALLDNISAAGDFNEDQFNAFMTQVKFELPSSPARDLITTAIRAVGAAGLSNMASYGGASAADCSSCGDDYIRIYAICNGGAGGTEIAWDGEYLTVQANPEGGHYVVRIVRDSVASASCVDEPLTPQFLIDSDVTFPVGGFADFVEYMNADNGYSGISPGLTPAWLVGAIHRATWTAESPFTIKLKATNAP